MSVITPATCATDTRTGDPPGPPCWYETGQGRRRSGSQGHRVWNQLLQGPRLQGGRQNSLPEQKANPTTTQVGPRLLIYM